MTKITTLDRAALKALRDPLEAELAAIGERFGLKLTLGNGSFGDGFEATFQLKMKVDDADAERNAAKANWDRNCRYIGVDFNAETETGLRPKDFDTEFAYGDGVYRTTGIAIKGRGSQKFPILAEVISSRRSPANVGKTMMLPETAVPLIRAATDAAKPLAA